MARRSLGDATMATQRANTSILALHGFTGAGADFAPFADLCGGTWHCPDLPGHGSDPQLDCAPDATVAFIRSQISSLRPRPSILLGYSMGARAALQHAVRYPDIWDALILISPNPGIEDAAERAERRAVDEKLARRIENEGVDAFIDFWQNTPMIRSQKKIRLDWWKQMHANRLIHTAEGLTNSLRHFGQGQCPNLWPNLTNLTMPVLLLTGADDAKYTRLAQRMFGQLPNAMQSAVEGFGHMPHLEGPEICADILDKFLRKTENRNGRSCPG
jgi:2-succinyl-6-hydroxy-2,4-cyclohexadiene-1-carboxylate synthase